MGLAGWLHQKVLCLEWILEFTFLCLRSSLLLFEKQIYIFFIIRVLYRQKNKKTVKDERKKEMKQ